MEIIIYFSDFDRDSKVSRIPFFTVDGFVVGFMEEVFVVVEECEV